MRECVCGCVRAYVCVNSQLYVCAQYSLHTVITVLYHNPYSCPTAHLHGRHLANSIEMAEGQFDHGH